MSNVNWSDTENCRFFDGSEANITDVGENVSIVDHDGSDLVLVTQISSYTITTGACNKDINSAGFRLEFSEDGGGFTPVGAATAVRYTENTSLVNDASTLDRVTAGTMTAYNAGCASGWITGIECTDGACSHNIVKERFSDIAWALDFSGATAGSVYTFQVYDTTNTAVLNPVVAIPSVTMAASSSSDSSSSSSSSESSSS